MESSENPKPALRSLAVLHPVFLLTGVLHVISGPLLPAIATTFHLKDNQSGLLFLTYFAGSSLGALLCLGKYAQAMAIGFVLAALSCLGIVFSRWPLLLLAFAILGIGVGLSMSAVSLYVGRQWRAQSAPVLVFLNFSWSLGALVAPLIAALVLAHASFRIMYALLAIAAVVAAAVSFVLLRDTTDTPNSRDATGNGAGFWAIATFAIACFLQVGIENTSAAWLTTYIVRTARMEVPFAATLSALYWTGFLLARAGAPYLLRRCNDTLLVRIAIPAAFAASLLLFLSRTQSLSSGAMFFLGLTLGPIYPLIVAHSFGRLPRVSDSRWILAAAGFGGSVMPWLTGWISVQSRSIRTGLLTLPAALLLLIVLLPHLFRTNLPALELQE